MFIESLKKLQKLAVLLKTKLLIIINTNDCLDKAQNLYKFMTLKRLNKDK